MEDDTLHRCSSVFVTRNVRVFLVDGEVQDSAFAFERISRRTCCGEALDRTKQCVDVRVEIIFIPLRLLVDQAVLIRIRVVHVCALPAESTSQSHDLPYLPARHGDGAGDVPRPPA